jgi:hypothetical protein
LLLAAAGSGAGGGGAGAGFGAGAAAFGGGAIADGGMSFITGFGAAAASTFAAAGFASSSAMMRRIDARISSIEGSWAFAACVISDSTSKPFYTKATKELPVPDMQAGNFTATA